MIKNIVELEEQFPQIARIKNISPQFSKSDSVQIVNYILNVYEMEITLKALPLLRGKR